MDNKTPKILIKQATRGNTRADYLHSSEYAKVQSGDRIGAAPGAQETFKMRQKRRREFLGRYDESKLTRESLHRIDPGTRTFTAPTPGEKTVGAQRWEAIQSATKARKEKI